MEIPAVDLLLVDVLVDAGCCASWDGVAAAATVGVTAGVGLGFATASLGFSEVGGVD